MDVQTGGFSFLVSDVNVLLIIELVAVATGLLYVILAVLKKKVAWLWGFTNAVISIWLFYQVALFAESFLYIYYALAAIYGWIHWSKSKSTNQEIHIVTINLKWHFVLLPLGLVIGVALGYVLDAYTEAAYPFLDAQTTVFSFIATAMTARRILSNWMYWIVIDMVTMVMYSLKDLIWYAALMLVYTGIAYLGWKRWKFSLQKSES